MSLRSPLTVNKHVGRVQGSLSEILTAFLFFLFFLLGNFKPRASVMVGADLRMNHCPSHYVTMLCVSLITPSFFFCFVFFFLSLCNAVIIRCPLKTGLCVCVRARVAGCVPNMSAFGYLGLRQISCQEGDEDMAWSAPLNGWLIQWKDKIFLSFKSQTQSAALSSWNEKKTSTSLPLVFCKSVLWLFPSFFLNEVTAPRNLLLRLLLVPQSTTIAVSRVNFVWLEI